MTLSLACVGKALIYEGYLKEVAIPNSFGSTVELSSKGSGWRRGASPLKLTPTTDMLAEMRPPVAVTVRYMYVSHLFQSVLIREYPHLHQLKLCVLFYISVGLHRLFLWVGVQVYHPPRRPLIGTVPRRKSGRRCRHRNRWWMRRQWELGYIFISHW